MPPADCFCGGRWKGGRDQSCSRRIPVAQQLDTPRASVGGAVHEALVHEALVHEARAKCSLHKGHGAVRRGIFVAVDCGRAAKVTLGCWPRALHALGRVLLHAGTLARKPLTLGGSLMMAGKLRGTGRPSFSVGGYPNASNRKRDSRLDRPWKRKVQSFFFCFPPLF